MPKTSLFSAAVLLALAAIASAGSVTVANAGFENPVLPEGSWTTSVPGWTIVNAGGSTGVFNPTLVQYDVGVVSGENVAFSRGGTFYTQTLAELLTADTTYTLDVAVGRRKDDGLPATAFEIQLRAGAAILATTDQTSDTPLQTGEFRDFSVVFAAPAAHTNLGDPMEIWLIANTGTLYQVNWDDIRLDASGPIGGAGLVPLPAAVYPALALLGFLGVWRRRRQ